MHSPSVCVRAASVRVLQCSYRLVDPTDPWDWIRPVRDEATGNIGCYGTDLVYGECCSDPPQERGQALLGLGMYSSSSLLTITYGVGYDLFGYYYVYSAVLLVASGVVMLVNGVVAAVLLRALKSFRAASGQLLNVQAAPPR